MTVADQVDRNMTTTATVAGLLAEIESLRRRLQEAEENAGTSRLGGVSSDRKRHDVYMLEGAELPYRVLTEHMQQGAAILRPDGVFLYCNQRLAESLGVDPSKLLGATLTEFVPAEQTAACQELIHEGAAGISRGEVPLLRNDGQRVNVGLAFNTLPFEGQRLIAMLVTDLSDQHAQQRAVELAERLEREIHKRIQAEQAVRTSEERYRSFIRQASEGVWRFEFEQPIPVRLPVVVQIGVASNP